MLECVVRLHEFKIAIQPTKAGLFI